MISGDKRVNTTSLSRHFQFEVTSVRVPPWNMYRGSSCCLIANELHSWSTYACVSRVKAQRWRVCDRFLKSNSWKFGEECIDMDGQPNSTGQFSLQSSCSCHTRALSSRNSSRCPKSNSLDCYVHLLILQRNLSLSARHIDIQRYTSLTQS